MAQRRNNCRKSHNSENRDGESGPWAELTGNLLVSIILRLGFIDSVSIGGVCGSWRTIVTDNRETILQQQRPLVVVKSTHAKKACFLYNMYDQIRYKTLLPDYLTYWRFMGLSCGYLIMLNYESKFWLLNLITRDELHFPALPRYFFFGLTETLPILIYSTDISDHFMLVVNRKMSSMLLSRRGGANWRTIPYKGKDGFFVDLTFFNNNVYVLTRDGRIGKVRVSPYLVLELLDVSISIPKSSFTPLQLATSKEHLFMVSFFCCGDIFSLKTEVVIHKLDEANMEWVKVNDMGDEAVFLSRMTGGSAVVNPTKWGDRSNCIHSLRSMFNRCSIFPLNSSQGLEEVTPVVPEPSILVPHFWYFPHLCYQRNSIEGSFDV